MKRFLPLLALASGGAFAAVPAEISTAVGAIGTDGSTIATAIVVAVFAVFAIKFLLKAK